MGSLKSVRITVRDNGTITMWKHELEVRVRDVSTGKGYVWDWKEFVSRMDTMYVPNSNAYSNKVTFRCKYGANTNDLLNVLKDELKCFFVDEEGDPYTCGFSALNVVILKTVSTKQAHVMHA